MSPRRIGGFTLVELMVTVAVLAILSAIAYPSFQGVIRSNRVVTTSNELLASLALARGEAVRNTRGAGVCASADGTNCGSDWSAGWLVWADLNGNGALDEGETVIQYSQANPQIAIDAGTGTITFDARGRTGSAQSLDVKPEGSDTPTRCVAVGATGQARVSRSTCP